MTQKYKQMSLLEVSLVSHLVKQDYKKAEQMIDGSGMKCLMLLSKSDRDGLLGKMCKALLTLKKAWYSDRCKMTWKVKVSKSNVSLFQLQVSVHGTTETEYGYWLQPPTTQDARIGPNNIGGNQHRKKRGSIALADQVLFPQEEGMEMIKMYPTPTAPDVQMKNGHFYRENKKGERWGVKLRDAVMYPTPTNSEHKYRLKGKSQASNCLEAKARKHGGKLNPEFVEFLMGYPMGWTEIEPKE
jgi:hypothetical protein